MEPIEDRVELTLEEAAAIIAKQDTVIAYLMDALQEVENTPFSFSPMCGEHQHIILFMKRETMHKVTAALTMATEPHHAP